MGAKAIIVNTPENIIQSDAHDWASIFNSVLGDVSGIIEYGRNLEAVIENNNTVQLSDGVYSEQGHILKVDKNTVIKLTVNSGTLGMNRKDLIIAEYTKASNPNRNDSLEFKVLQGTPKAQGGGVPVPPALVSQDLHDGGSKRQEALYEINIANTTITSVKRVCELITSIKDLGSLHEKVNKMDLDLKSMLLKVYPIGSIYTSVDNLNPNHLFGGTWTAFGKGRTLVGFDTAQAEFNKVEKVGGHKATERHTHSFSGKTGKAGKFDPKAMVASDQAGASNAALMGYKNEVYRQSITQIPDHEHSFSGNTAAFGTGNAGNLQPYIVVSFWKRIA